MKSLNGIYHNLIFNQDASNPYGIYLVYKPYPLHHPDKHRSGWR